MICKSHTTKRMQQTFGPLISEWQDIVLQGHPVLRFS